MAGGAVHASLRAGDEIELYAPSKVTGALRAPAIFIARGAVMFALTATFAGIDWMMSLEPAFNSSIYGLTLMSGQAVAGFALALVVTLGISETSGRIAHLREEGLIGLGSLLYGLVLLALDPLLPEGFGSLNSAGVGRSSPSPP